MAEIAGNQWLHYLAISKIDLGRKVVPKQGHMYVKEAVTGIYNIYHSVRCNRISHMSCPLPHQVENQSDYPHRYLISRAITVAPHF